MKKLLLAALALGLIAVAGILALERLDLARVDTPIAGLVGARSFVVEPGRSLQAVARQLGAEGLLQHPGSFTRHARRSGFATQLKAGEYLVEPGTTPRALLERIVAGAVLLHSLTIPEGWTLRQAVEAIQAHEAVDLRLVDVSAGAIARAIGLDGQSPEGRIFPDTYRFARGTSDIELLQRGRRQLEAELDAAWQARADGLPLQNPYEALILASIVEKETGIDEERPIIAGVFVNRLRRGMRLQTDPTVIYGLGEDFDGNLRRADMVRDTPWNTYTRAGLPPTPIALVGRDALLAAVQPADTGALYFVATGRGDGRHYFARTLAEHNDNVARYIAALRGATKDGAR